MRRPIALLLSTGALALGVAACGGSSAHPATSASSATTTASSATGSAGATGSKLMLSAPSSGALRFDMSSLTAHAGTVTITFVNHSSVEHNLTVVKGSNGTVLGATPTFSGGSKTLTLHLSAGSYTYYCSVPGHRQAGMQGTLKVS